MVGSATSRLYTLALDDTAPTVKILTPQSRDTLSDQLNFTAQVTDSVGVDDVFFRLGNDSFQGDWMAATLNRGNNTGGNWSGVLDTSGWDDGFYDLWVNASDLLGNEFAGVVVEDIWVDKDL